MTAQEPKGKRHYKQNVYGNYVGYIGRARWIEFGDKPWSEEWAKVWANTELDMFDAECVALNNRNAAGK